MLSFYAFGSSDRGCTRPVNEDAFLIEYLNGDETGRTGRKGVIAIVADGVGGHAGGEFASSESVRVILKELRRHSFADGPEVLKDAIERAHQHLKKLGSEQEKLKNMGTTCTALWIENSQAYVAQVGDSRAYLIRNNVVFQITEDQTLVRQLVKKGVITNQEAVCHPQKNLILHALGISKSLKIDIFQVNLVQNDIILLCTDGLYNFVEDSELTSLATKYPPREAVDILIQLAKKRGGSDNITAVILKDVNAVPKEDESKKVTREHDNLQFFQDTRKIEMPTAGHKKKQILILISFLLAFIVLFLIYYLRNRFF